MRGSVGAMRRLAPLLASVWITACCIPTPEREAPAPAIAPTAAPVRAAPGALLEIEAPPDQEPPLQLLLTSGGRTTPAVPGHAVRLGDAPDAPEVTVELHPHRLFHRRGLRFTYPRAYGFEAELDAQVEEWVLSGNDHKIMVFFYVGLTGHEPTRRDVVANVTRNFGPTARVEPVTLELGGRTYSGDRVLATLVGHDLRTDIVSFAGTGGAFILMFQDNGSEGSAEGAATMGLLARELRVE